MERWKDKAEFKACVMAYAAQMQIAVKSLTLRAMTTKWASFSTDGNLNFNTELLAMRKELGQYVIVHELLHFRIPNHGKLWKSMLSALIGDWQRLDDELKAIHSQRITE